jgi:two-component system NtrC family sensor kinase
MVVDDDPAVVRACAAILADEGYQVWATTDGAAARAQLDKEQFDLLLLDLKMPGVDGLTILRRARELDPGATAVFVTGHGSMQLAIEALRGGARDFLLKPFDIDELVETVGRALEDRRREQETLLLQAVAQENARRYEMATQARQEWETTFDVIDDGIAIVDANLHILRANRSLARRLQSPSLELVGRDLAKLLGHGDADDQPRIVLQALRSGQPQQVEREIPALRGIFVASAFPVPDEEGEVERVVYVLREVTERRRVERELRQQYEYLVALHQVGLGLLTRRSLDDLLEAIVAPMCSLVGTDHGLICLLSDGDEAMEVRVGRGLFLDSVGRRLEKGQGLVSHVWQTAQSFVVDDYARWPDRLPDLHLDALNSAVGIPLISGPKVVGVLLVAHTERDREIPFDEIALLGQFAALAAIAVDNTSLYQEAQKEIAERRRTEEALRWSEARYRNFVEKSYEGVWEIDREGRTLFANRRMAHILGYDDPMEMMGRHFRDFAPEIDLEGLLAPAAAGEGQEGELEDKVLHRRDASTADVILSVQLHEEGEDDQGGATLFITDITERKQMEQVLLRTERLAAMGHLAAALAHEINNPLQSIGNSMELVLDFPLEEEERREYLEAMRREIGRLMALTRRVLDFARPPRVGRQPISIPATVRQALTLAGKQLSYGGIDVHLDLPEDLPLVRASDEQLVQVFLNLIINASEAMPDGGDLRISARAVGDRLELSFADSGPGIRPEVLSRVFEPFHTTKPEGSGLGLAISYSIVQQHGGSIVASNAPDPDGGAVLTLILPAVPTRDAPSEENA